MKCVGRRACAEVRTLFMAAPGSARMRRARTDSYLYLAFRGDAYFACNQGGLLQSRWGKCSKECPDNDGSGGRAFFFYACAENPIQCKKKAVFSWRFTHFIMVMMAHARIDQARGVEC